MSKNLIIFGLGLIAAWVLLKLAAAIVEIALYAGGLLLLIGIIWYVLERSESKRA